MTETTWLTSTRSLPELHADAADAARWMKDAHASAVSTVRQMRAEVAAIDARWDVGADDRARGRALARAKAREALDMLDFQRQIAQARIDEYVNRATAAQVEGGDPAAESQRASAWARLRGQLDALPADAPRSTTAARMLDEAARAGDRATLEAARRELPAYLATQREDMPEGLARDLDVIAGPQVARDARAFEDSIAVGAATTAEAIRSLAYYLGDESSRPAVVPSFDGAEAINVEEG